ncbi:MAG TPA: rhombosortase [Steroidobacter sp.]|jgi:rhomboid family GlyGly-CTERM serine protease|nr:rhombosortase [Steroidobacter sp.]
MAIDKSARPEPAQAVSPAIGLAQSGWLVGLLLATLVLLGLGGDAVRLTLRYEKQAVLEGEYWRLATAHLVHGSTLHLALNSVGLLLIGALFPRDYSPRAWLLIALFSAAAIDVGFVFYEPQLDWYLGFSGVLHGALAAGAIAWLRHESRPLAWALALLLAGKLIWEQVRGGLPLAGALPVVVDAHLYGALGGAIAAGIVCVGERHWPLRRPPL